MYSRETHASENREAYRCSEDYPEHISGQGSKYLNSESRVMNLNSPENIGGRCDVQGVEATG